MMAAGSDKTADDTKEGMPTSKGPEEDDVSSGADEADSDDIDSEGLAEEILGHGDEDPTEIAGQQDYIHF